MNVAPAKSADPADDSIASPMHPAVALDNPKAWRRWRDGKKPFVGEGRGQP